MPDLHDTGIANLGPISDRDTNPPIFDNPDDDHGAPSLRNFAEAWHVLY